MKKVIVVALLVLGLVAATATAAFAPKRYKAPRPGTPAVVSMPQSNTWD